MLDLKRIRDDTDLVRTRLARRNATAYDALIDVLLRLDEERRSAIAEVDQLRARRNEVSPQVGKLKQAGREEDAAPLVLEMRELSERMAEREARRTELESAVRDALLMLPNLPEDAVPAGDESHNVVVRSQGEPPAEGFERRPHWEIAEQHGLLDLPRGAKITGSGFPVYVGAGARLERALINFMVDLHAREHGYTEVSPPFVDRKSVV